MKSLFWLLAAGSVLAGGTARAYDVAEKSIGELRVDLDAGRVTSAELVQLYEARIATLNPQLHAVIAVNPQALDQARAADAARKTHNPRNAQKAGGALAGVPILIKDNIESADPIPTTAGSLALAGNVTGRDAPLVARLRTAGAIILGDRKSVV